jgi:hypothetical protein
MGFRHPAVCIVRQVHRCAVGGRSLHLAEGTVMKRPSLLAALGGAAAALVVAAIANAVLTLLAGDTLEVPGELGLGQVLTFTLVMIVPAAIVLWLLPRWFPAISIAVAVLTIVFPFMEFGTPIAWWLAAMHLLSGVCAAVLAPGVAARTDRRALTA